MVNLTRIYTRTGDAGRTRLGDMSETSKNDLRLHAYADVDEANAHIGAAIALGGLDEDAVHWIGVAVRESVINAIKHGNREDAWKLVTVEFTFAPIAEPSELVVRVLDQGEGFDPEEIADPLAPENLLKSSGRGIFFMRSFMDDVTLRRASEGGMEVRMVKKLAPGD